MAFTAGDPDDEKVLWTDLSPQAIAETVAAIGTPVSPPVVADWLDDQGIKRRKIAKTAIPMKDRLDTLREEVKFVLQQMEQIRFKQRGKLAGSDPVSVVIIPVEGGATAFRLDLSQESSVCRTGSSPRCREVRLRQA